MWKWCVCMLMFALFVGKNIKIWIFDCTERKFYINAKIWQMYKWERWGGGGGGGGGRNMGIKVYETGMCLYEDSKKSIA